VKFIGAQDGPLCWFLAEGLVKERLIGGSALLGAHGLSLDGIEHIMSK